jgi:hypothetical protein
MSNTDITTQAHNSINRAHHEHLDLLLLLPVLQVLEVRQLRGRQRRARQLGVQAVLGRHEGEHRWRRRSQRERNTRVPSARSAGGDRVRSEKTRI